MRNYSYSVLFFLLLVSCTSNLDFNEYQSVENHQWDSNDPIEFIVDNRDTISKKNVFINIRSNKNYAFSSIFILSKIEFPKGLQIVDTLEYEMTDAAGNWLGTGFTDVKENKLFYKEQVVFEESGPYKFTIQHATRGINDIEGNHPLEGITDVGLSIEIVKE